MADYVMHIVVAKEYIRKHKNEINYANGNTHAITYRIYGSQLYSDDYLGFRIVLY